MRMCQLSAAEAAAFCSAPQDAAALSCGPVVALELMAPCGVRRWLDMLGASLGAHGVPADAVHGSDSSAAAAHELAVFFGASPAGASASSRPTSSAAGSLSGAGAGWGGSSGAGGGCAATSLLRSCCRCQGTTLGVILPHAVKEGVAGLMLSEVQAEFDMTGLQQFWLDKLAAAEFLEVRANYTRRELGTQLGADGWRATWCAAVTQVYKGAVPPGEFVAMVDELVAGPCIAVEVAARTGGCPVEAFRQLVGPRDPELGRVLRPNTLRARFGASRVRNAMHCTDLEEDGQLETSYFFIVLQQHNQARAVGPAAAVGVC
jgi:nucleoside-diphosphate kinase